MRAAPLVPSLVALALSAACSPAAARPGPKAPAHAAKLAAAPASPAERLKSGSDALAASDYATAEADLRAAAVGAQRGEALIGLAEVMLHTGRYAEAVRIAAQAGAVKGARADAAWIGAEALRREGKIAEAEATLRKVEALPEARHARLLLGEVLIEQGRRREAEAPLMTLVEDYNSERIAPTDGHTLAMVGRAAHLLRSPSDANDAFNEAEKATKGDVPTLLWRAELFLEKYDPGHAAEVTKEILAKAPNLAEAHVWMAHVLLAQALDFDAAEAEARAALKVNPRLGGAHFVLAGISLRDVELAEADRHVADGLKFNPRDLDLLSMKAAIRFLADDAPGFEAAKKAVLRLNPEYARMYEIIGDFADWEHRYDEIVAMMREALRVDPEDARAQAQLGLNLIRGGEEADALKELDLAFKKDAFNVRVYNTLNLYEKDVARDYVTVDHGRFRIRYHKEEKAILDRYIPRMLNEAWGKFVGYYGFTPSTPVGVELYAERDNFAVRTSGLPGTAIQGVCFGKTLASMSPKDEKFNIGMTLWHELAHVFHIQLSKAHVPRWFTEGMAEYETIVARPEWKREQDTDLYEALRSDRMPKIGSMNKAFTRAEELNDVATAYYASSQIMVWMSDTFGRPKLDEMLRLWGSGQATPEVVQTALGVSADELDRRFREHVKTQLARYEKQFVPISRPGPLDAAKAAAEKAPKDAGKQIRFALSAARNADAETAEKLLAKTLALDPKQPDALWMKARMALGNKDVATGEATLRAMLQNGADGYSVQMALADVAEGKGDAAGMKAAFEAAHRFDPSQAEPVQALVDLAKKQNRPDDELAGLRDLATLEEHDPRVYRRLMRALLDRKLDAEARSVGEAAVFVGTEEIETHVLFAEALLAGKMLPRAIYELESAALCPGRPQDKADVEARLAEAYLAVPNRKAARQHATAAKKLDATNERLKKLKL